MLSLYCLGEQYNTLLPATCHSEKFCNDEQNLNGTKVHLKISNVKILTKKINSVKLTTFQSSEALDTALPVFNHFNCNCGYDKGPNETESLIIFRVKHFCRPFTNESPQHLADARLII